MCPCDNDDDEVDDTVFNYEILVGGFDDNDEDNKSVGGDVDDCDDGDNDGYEDDDDCFYDDDDDDDCLYDDEDDVDNKDENENIG